MQIQSEPKGWSDAEVDELLQTTADILVETQNIDQMLQNIEYLNNYNNSMVILAITVLYALVFLFSINIGWYISPYFLPAPKDLAP